MGRCVWLQGCAERRGDSVCLGLWRVGERAHPGSRRPEKESRLLSTEWSFLTGVQCQPTVPGTWGTQATSTFTHVCREATQASWRAGES